MTFIGINFGPVGGVTPAPAGLCTVLFSVQSGGEFVENATVTAKLEGLVSVVDDAIIASTVNSAVTDSGGQATLTLVQIGQFRNVGIHNRGGIYLIEVKSHGGDILYRRRVTIPNQSTADAHLLPDAL